MTPTLFVASCILAASTATSTQSNDVHRGTPIAPTLAGLNLESTSDTAALPHLNKTMAETTEANVSLQKERNAYTDDQKQKLEWARAAIQYQTDVVRVARLAPHNTEVARYNSQCSGTFEQAQYNICMSWKGRLEDEAQRLDTEWAEYAAQWNKENIDPVNVAIAKQNLRIAVIDRQIKGNFATFSDAQERSIALRKRIKAIEDLFRGACTGRADSPFTAAEALKWCHSVNWDGASVRLTPMYKYEGTGGATAN